MSMSKLLVILPILIVFSAGNSLMAMAPAVDPEGLWAQVKKADGQGLPKTAVEHLDTLIEQARTTRNYPWLLRGLTARWTRKAQITGDVAKERIILAEKELPTAEKYVRPLLHTVLAAWYWDYYSNNRYRFQNRSATKGLDDSDFTTWDLPKLFQQIDFHYEKALRPAKWLKKLDTSLWQPFIQKGSSPEGHRPKLYDFVAHEALKFYESGDQPTPKAFDAFELDCNSKVFDNASVFTDWVLDTSDTQSPLVKAIGLYQKLISFHREKGDIPATLQVDLDRLDFAKSKSYGANKDERYIEALRFICKHNRSSDLVTYAFWKLALAVHGKGDYVEAMKIASEGASLFPSSTGAKNCISLMTQMKMKSLSINGERTIVPGTGTIAITYKNIEQVHFRVYGEKWESLSQP